MKFSIDTFIANLDQGRVTNHANYSVLITGPQQLGSRVQEIDLMFRCDSITQPGRNIQITTDAYEYGLPIARASGSSFSEIDMTLILSEDERERLYFERWQDLMVGRYRNNILAPNMYDVGYFNDYVGNIAIMRDDANNLPVYKATLKNCFPVTIGDVPLNWDDNSLVKLSVRFWFQYYVDEPNAITSLIKLVTG